MIEEGRHAVNVVAQETGFADRERMRRAFVRTFGLPPQALRRNARLEAIMADAPPTPDRMLHRPARSC
jgi:transcriptional regulator GlxA family with amidase domain